MIAKVSQFFIIDKLTSITATNTMALALGLEAIVVRNTIRSLDSDLLNHSKSRNDNFRGGIRIQAHGFEQARQVLTQVFFYFLFEK